jgi:hypothetical protein
MKESENIEPGRTLRLIALTEYRDVAESAKALPFPQKFTISEEKRLKTMGIVETLYGITDRDFHDRKIGRIIIISVCSC